MSGKSKNLQSFNLNDRVFAKMKSYPIWPAKIIEIIGNDKFKVFFYGTHDCAIVSKSNVTKYDSMKNNIPNSKLKSYLSAVKEIKQDVNNKLFSCEKIKRCQKAASKIKKADKTVANNDVKNKKRKISTSISDKDKAGPSKRAKKSTKCIDFSIFSPSELYLECNTPEKVPVRMHIKDVLTEDIVANIHHKDPDLWKSTAMYVINYIRCKIIRGDPVPHQVQLNIDAAQDAASQQLRRNNPNTNGCNSNAESKDSTDPMEALVPQTDFVIESKYKAREGAIIENNKSSENGKFLEDSKKSQKTNLEDSKHERKSSEEETPCKSLNKEFSIADAQRFEEKSQLRDKKSLEKEAASEVSFSLEEGTSVANNINLDEEIVLLSHSKNKEEELTKAKVILGEKIEEDKDKDEKHAIKKEEYKEDKHTNEKKGVKKEKHTNKKKGVKLEKHTIEKVRFNEEKHTDEKEGVKKEKHNNVKNRVKEEEHIIEIKGVKEEEHTNGKEGFEQEKHNNEKKGIREEKNNEKEGIEDKKRNAKRAVGKKEQNNEKAGVEKERHNEKKRIKEEKHNNEKDSAKEVKKCLNDKSVIHENNSCSSSPVYKTTPGSDINRNNLEETYDSENNVIHKNTTNLSSAANSRASCSDINGVSFEKFHNSSSNVDSSKVSDDGEQFSNASDISELINNASDIGEPINNASDNGEPINNASDSEPISSASDKGETINRASDNNEPIQSNTQQLSPSMCNEKLLAKYINYYSKRKLKLDLNEINNLVRKNLENKHEQSKEIYDKGLPNVKTQKKEHADSKRILEKNSSKRVEPEIEATLVETNDHHEDQSTKKTDEIPKMKDTLDLNENIPKETVKYSGALTKFVQNETVENGNKEVIIKTNHTDPNRNNYNTCSLYEDIKTINNVVNVIVSSPSTFEKEPATELIIVPTLDLYDGLVDIDKESNEHKCLSLNSTAPNNFLEESNQFCSNKEHTISTVNNTLSHTAIPSVNKNKHITSNSQQYTYIANIIENGLSQVSCYPESIQQESLYECSENVGPQMTIEDSTFVHQSKNAQGRSQERCYPESIQGVYVGSEGTMSPSNVKHSTSINQSPPVETKTITSQSVSQLNMEESLNSNVSQTNDSTDLSESELNDLVNALFYKESQALLLHVNLMKYLRFNKNQQNSCSATDLYNAEYIMGELYRMKLNQFVLLRNPQLVFTARLIATSSKDLIDNNNNNTISTQNHIITWKRSYCAENSHSSSSSESNSPYYAESSSTTHGSDDKYQCDHYRKQLESTSLTFLQYVARVLQFNPNENFYDQFNSALSKFWRKTKHMSWSDMIYLAEQGIRSNIWN